MVSGVSNCSRPTLVEYRDAIGHGKRFVVIVRDEDRCGLRAAQQIMQFLPHPSGHIRIKVAERFIEQEQDGMLHQRPSESHALLLTAGQLMRVATFEAFQADQTEHVLHTHFSLAPAQPAQAEGNVLLNTEVGE